ncbi:insulinase family protein [Lysobacter psychrotolerans]|uniref:Insulinase family protein n=2 Tax=Montanilutibacter psychrotolerans TaxID=1327343 RepID=A0A3M8SYR7_9GAMM|nr:insulinase family protein [Lysobacter psychrotolerans]
MAAATGVDAGAPRPAASTNASVAVRLPEFETLTLANGATVLLMEKHDVPLVAASISVRGGSLADPVGKEGTAALLAELLGKGAGTRDALAFAQTVDGVGGSIGFGSDQEGITAAAQFLSRDTGLMLSLLGDALLNPRLDATEFDKLRKRSIEAIAAAKDSDPRALVSDYASAWLFRGHAYGRPGDGDGDETSLAAIGLTDLQAFRQAQMGGDRLIIALVGDFDSATVREQVTATFGGWAKATGTLPEVVAKPRESGRRVLLVDKPGATQTYFWLGNVGASRTDPARAAQDLVQTAFGGRFTSMLNTELRVKSGLTYGAGAPISRARVAGMSGISTFTKTESTGAAIDLALATLARLHKDGLDAATLTSAKNYVAGQFAPDLETAPQLADTLVDLTTYGLGRDDVDGYLGRIAAASAEDVGTARAVYASGDDQVIVAIGDAAKIRTVIAEYGPVTEMKLTDPHYAPAE